MTFSKKNLFEFLKNCVKLIFLGYLIYKIIVASVPALLLACYGTIDDLFPILKTILKNLAAYTVFGYVVIAIVDRIFQQKNFTKQIRKSRRFRRWWFRAPTGSRRSSATRPTPRASPSSRTSRSPAR